MQLTKTIFSEFVIVIEKKWIENWLCGKSDFLGGESIHLGADLGGTPKQLSPSALREILGIVLIRQKFFTIIV